MKTLIALTFLLVLPLVDCARADTFGGGANAFNIEFVPIGKPGNPADTTGEPDPAGSVPYAYRIGKFEVSRDMVTKASAEGNLGLTMFSLFPGGVRPDMPATGVNWFQAARFVNWLNVSQGFPAAYKFSTQPGDVGYSPNATNLLWQPSDLGYDPDNRFRNSLARYFLPSVHEWYKAAYYDPNANGGAGQYWNYPSGSNSPPMCVASGTSQGTAVCNQTFEQGPADISKSGGLSPYGVIGLGGNAQEWEETEFDLTNTNGSSFRGVQRGRWDGPVSNSLVTLGRGGDDFPPSAFGSHVGFRVASTVIPEPSSCLLFAMSGLAFFLTRRRLTARPCD